MNEDVVSQRIQELSDIELPTGLHGKIMQRLLFLKFRTPFIVVVSLLVLNLGVSGWNIWERLSEMEAFTVLTILWENLEMSLAGLQEFAAVAFELLPVTQTSLFVVNLSIIAYVVLFLPRAFTKHKHGSM